MPDTDTNAGPCEWLIYSTDHGCWWGANRSGYFTDIDGAGRYTFEEAKRITDQNCPRAGSSRQNARSDLMVPAPESHSAFAGRAAAQADLDVAREALEELLVASRNVSTNQGSTGRIFAAWNSAEAALAKLEARK